MHMPAFVSVMMSPVKCTKWKAKNALLYKLGGGYNTYNKYKLY